MCSNPADLITFTEEILNRKLHFLCSGSKYNKILESSEIKRRISMVLVKIYGAYIMGYRSVVVVKIFMFVGQFLNTSASLLSTSIRRNTFWYHWELNQTLQPNSIIMQMTCEAFEALVWLSFYSWLKCFQKN